VADATKPLEKEVYGTGVVYIGTCTYGNFKKTMFDTEQKCCLAPNCGSAPL
jgi:hypothetical protein